jgi:hypothetical protein
MKCWPEKYAMHSLKRTLNYIDPYGPVATFSENFWGAGYEECPRLENGRRPKQKPGSPWPGFIV